MTSNLGHALNAITGNTPNRRNVEQVGTAPWTQWVRASRHDLLDRGHQVLFQGPRPAWPTDLGDAIGPVHGVGRNARGQAKLGLEMPRACSSLA